MFSKEESKQIREQFWIFFGKRHPRKWLLYDTKVKEINLKFSFDTSKAQVSFDIETNDDLFRTYYFEKFESLKKLLKEETQELMKLFRYLSLHDLSLLQVKDLKKLSTTAVNLR